MVLQYWNEEGVKQKTLKITCGKQLHGLTSPENEEAKWDKTCGEARLPSRKLKTLVKTRLASEVVFFPSEYVYLHVSPKLWLICGFTIKRHSNDELEFC